MVEQLLALIPSRKSIVIEVEFAQTDA